LNSAERRAVPSAAAKLVGRSVAVGWAESRGPECRDPDLKAKNKIKTNLTDLQILGCELHKNAFGGRVPPGPLVEP